MASTVCAVREAEPLKDGGMAFSHTAISRLVDHVDVSFGAWVRSQLLQLCLVQIDNIAAIHGEVSLNLKLILVRYRALNVFKVVPVLNACKFVI